MVPTFSAFRALLRPQPSEHSLPGRPHPSGGEAYAAAMFQLICSIVSVLNRDGACALFL